MRRLALLVALAASTPAFAVFQCGDTQDTCQCGANNPYPCCDNGGNCTWYAWHGACCALGVGLPGWGNANQWTGRARANGAYAVHASPVVNAVSCRDVGTYGHVAFVTALNGGSSLTVREQNCWGNYGARTWTYQTSYWTGGFITTAGQVQCRPGDAQQQSCGNCGTQSRGCGNDGKWGGWSTCSSQGECRPGDERDVACGDCGTAKRTCTSSCQWGAAGRCAASPAAASAEPSGCDTGKAGACAAGAKVCLSDGLTACVQSTPPSAETCNGVDDDCDGLVDGPTVCVVTLGAPPSEDAPLAAREAETDRMSVTGLGCTSSGAGPLGLLAAALLRRRR